MAKYERIGDAVLEVSEVELARVVEGKEPELRLMLRAGRSKSKLVHIRTESVAEAYTCLAELAQVTSLVRVGRALVPTSQVQRAQAVATHQVKGANDELEDAGPALRVHLQRAGQAETVHLPADSLEQARAWLEELLQLMNMPADQRPAAPEPTAEAESWDPGVAAAEEAEEAEVGPEPAHMEMPPAAEAAGWEPQATADGDPEDTEAAGWTLTDTEGADDAVREAE